MRVLLSALSCNPVQGSEALVGYKYAEALTREHQVTVIASPPARSPRGAKLQPISAGSCNFNDVAPSALARFEIIQFPFAWRLNQERRFDVVHRVTPSWIGNSSVLPALRAPFVIGPLLASEPPPESFRPILAPAVNGRRWSRFHPQRLISGLAWRGRDWLARRQYHLRSARRILVGSQVAYQHVPRELRSRCELLAYSGVEHDFFMPPPARAANRPLQLLFVGRLVPYKGLELLLRAVAEAAPRLELRLRVVGSGDSVYAEYCRTLAKQLGIVGVIEFLPAVARRELLRLYQQADVFCFPTLCDTYGVALLEAMSCGCAILTTDSSGPREIVNDSFGIKVPLSDPRQYVREFAEGIVTLARAPSLREEMGRRARRQVELHHDWHTIGHRLVEIYKGL